MTGFLFVVMHNQDFVAILAPISLLLFMAAHATRFTVPLQVPRELALIAFLIVYLVLGMMVNKSLVGISVIDFMKNYGKIFYALGLFVVFFFLRPGTPVEKTIYPATIVAGFLVSLLTLYNYFVSPISFGAFSIKSGNLMTGPLGGHNVTAASLGLQVVLFLVAIFASRKDRSLCPLKPTPIYLLMACVIGVTFVLAESRGFSAELLTAVGLMCLFILRRDIPKIMGGLNISRAGAQVGILLLFMLVGSLYTLSSRLTNVGEVPNVLIRLAFWLRAVNVFSLSPLFGLGLGTFQQTDIVVTQLIPGLIAVKSSGTYLDELIHGSTEGGMHAHNQYLELLAEVGLVGLVLVMGLFFSGIVRSVPQETKGSEYLGADYDRIVCAAGFNKQLVIYLFAYLAVSGMAGGYTMTSPTSGVAPLCGAGEVCPPALYLLRISKELKKYGAIG